MQWIPSYTVQAPTKRQLSANQNPISSFEHLNTPNRKATQAVSRATIQLIRRNALGHRIIL